MRIIGKKGLFLLSITLFSSFAFSQRVSFREQLEATRQRKHNKNTNSYTCPPLDKFVLTSGFGPRWKRKHLGLDLDCKKGDPIKAVRCGQVVFAGKKGGYGKCVIIKTCAGTEQLYGHCDQLKVVAGDHVVAGRVIALGGNTGNTTGKKKSHKMKKRPQGDGSHLHFEERINGKPINPLKKMREVYKKSTTSLTTGGFNYFCSLLSTLNQQTTSLQYSLTFMSKSITVMKIYKKTEDPE